MNGIIIVYKMVVTWDYIIIMINQKNKYVMD